MSIIAPSQGATSHQNTAGFKLTTYTGHFTDSAIYDPVAKTARSVRDGVLRYTGAELDQDGASLDPEKTYTVYRSPATIANAAIGMTGIAITNEHVPLDLPPPSGNGLVTGGEMVDLFDSSTSSTVAVLSKIDLSDKLAALVDAGKNELSLGYTADLIDHPEYDFEQRSIKPHHLAVVPSGRCGSICSFLDAIKTEETDSMPLHKSFLDKDGTPSIQQIMELATALPEAIKTIPADQLVKLTPALQKIVEAAKSAGAMPGEPAAEEPETPSLDENDPEKDKPEEEDAPMKDEDKKEEDEKKFSDAVAVATTDALKAHTVVMEKARQFMDDAHSFAGKSTADIMREALATQSKDEFTDAELPIAFKLLKKTESNYKNFADSAGSKLVEIANQEL